MAPQHGPLSRPRVAPPPHIPVGRPDSTLPPGYRPPKVDLQRSGAILQQQRAAKLSRRQILVLAFAGVGLILVVLIAAALVVSNALNQTSAPPQNATRTFFNALESENYTLAYAQLSPTAKASQSQAAFTSHYQQLDNVGGPIVQFTIQSVSTSGAHATVTVSTQRNTLSGHVILYTVQMAQIASLWYVDTVSS